MFSPDSPELECKGPGPLSSLVMKRFVIIARIQMATKLLLKMSSGMPTKVIPLILSTGSGKAMQKKK